MSPDNRGFLSDLFTAAIDAARPAVCVPPHLPPRPKGRTVVVGAGKAAASMAAAVEARWKGPIQGLVVTRYGHRVVAKVMAGIARSCAQHGVPGHPPCVLLSGGETTVTVRGGGRGGRNAEFLLALAVALEGHPHIAALAGDTDGIDGSESNAGAIITPDTLSRAVNLGIDAKRHLADNDGYGFFSALGDLVMTGPTLTSVNDFRAILVVACENGEYPLS